VRTQVSRGSQRCRIDMRPEGEHRDAALHQVANPSVCGGVPQLDDRNITWLVARGLGACSANHLLQLAAKKEIAGFDEDALQPASFWVRYSTSLPAATRSCFSVSRSRTVTV